MNNVCNYEMFITQSKIVTKPGHVQVADNEGFYINNVIHNEVKSFLKLQLHEADSFLRS